MEKIEIIIRDNGTLTERTIRERDLKAEGEVLDELTADVTRSQRNVLAIPDWGVAHANVGLFDTIWSVAINRIPLKARFKLVNSVLVPMFASMTDLEMPMVWTAPPAVRLIRSPQIFIDGEESPRSSPQTSVNICAAQKICGGLNWSGRIAPGGHGHLSLVLGRPAVVNRSAGWRLSKSLREQLPARLLVSAGLVTGMRCAIRKE